MSEQPKEVCPWCGERPEVCLKVGLEPGYYVECSSFKCDMQPGTEACRTKEEAIEIWDYRRGEK